jgi:hypothetical protein
MQQTHMKQKTMVLSGVIVAALAISGGLFFYFQNKETTPIPILQSETKNEAAKAKPAEESITPLRLDYAISNFGPGQNNTISYYIENKTICDNRPAYLGLMEIQSNDKNSQTQYAKFTIYADNGQMAVSTWVNETGMAFDDAVSRYNDLDLPLMLNGLFAYAGKNFNDSEYRETTSPILLKNVSTGQSTGDYSIIPQENDNSGAIPCKKFKMVVKSTNTDGFFNACVAQKIGDINLPFVVSMAFENAQGPGWTLKSSSNEKSKVAWIPQCLVPITCENIAQPAQSERTACNLRNGQIETNFDQQGCITEYKCMTQAEIASATIARMQNPQCSVSQKVIDKYLQCRKNNMPNFDPAGYDQQGCLVDIVNCRQ